MDNINGTPINYHKLQTRKKRIAGCRCDSRKKNVSARNTGKSNSKINIYEGLKNPKRIKSTICSDFHLLNNIERSKMLEKLRMDVQEGKYHVNFDRLAEKLTGMIMGEYL